jgi:hypothetical protein
LPSCFGMEMVVIPSLIGASGFAPPEVSDDA